MNFTNPKFLAGFFFWHALRWLVTISLVVLLAIVAYIGIRFYHIDNQLYLWWGAARHSQTAITTLKDQQHYRMDIDGRAVTGINRNLSGLAYNTNTNQLIAAINRPATLLTIDLEGNVLQRHRLSHALDVEGIA